MSITMNGKNIFTLNKSVRGYSHLEKNIPCQDYSDLYQDNKKIIITACDGHGGNIYIRSDVGSKLASEAAISVLKKYRKKQIDCMLMSNNLDAIKIEILCKWNELVEQDYSKRPFDAKELETLSEDDVFFLRLNPVLAYGTTLNAAMITEKHVVCVQIGDGGLFLIDDEGYRVAFEDNNENVANVTYSLCSDKAFNYMFVSVVMTSDIKGVFLCTDGVLTPYQTLHNFCDTFIRPIESLILEKGDEAKSEINDYIITLGEKIGNGDDVSLGIYYCH